MPQKQTQKVKGCKKCGRNKKKQAAHGNPISMYVRNVITANEYFRLTNQTAKGK